MTDYKKYFPWFKNNKNCYYLDNSATSLKPQCVINEVVEYYSKYSTNPHNNDSALAAVINKKIADTRKKVAKFLNVKNPNEIVFTSGATESLNIVVNNVASWLNKGDEVVLSYAEHASNLLPWLNVEKQKKVKVVFAGEKDTNTPTTNAFIKAINSKTKVISFSNASNLFGYEIDIKKIVTAARKINKDIIVIIDGTQSAPHCITNISNWNIDFFVCSAHKMCGPSGVGVMWGKMALLEKITLMTKVGGGSASTIESNKKVNLAPIPARFEAGTPNTEGILGFGAAIDFLEQIGMKNIIQKEHELKQYFDKKIIDVKNIDYVSKEAKFPICSFNINGVNPQDLANYLGKAGIIVRGGLACAKLSYKITKNTVGYVRASFYFYNDFKDIDVLINALKKFDKKNIADAIL